MQDRNKTKEQLINELAEMRQRIIDLEESDNPKRTDEEVKELETANKKLTDANSELLTVKEELRRKYKELQVSEDALILANQKLNNIIDFLPDATFVVGQDKKVVAWNKAMEQMTGVRKNYIIGKGNYIYGIPFYGKPQPLLVDLVWADNPDIEKNYPFVGRDGDTIYTEIFLPDVIRPSIFSGDGAYLKVKASPLFDDSGNMVGAIESIRDITQQKQLEKILEKSEERFRLLAENARDFIYRLGVLPTPHFEYLSQAITPLIGYEPEDLYQDIGLFLQLVHPDDKQKLTQFITGSLPVKEQLTLRFLRTDGQIVWLETSNTPVCDEQGQLVAIEGIARNITKRIQVEEALRESEKRLELILQTAATPIIIIDPNCKITFVNEEFCLITGYSRKNIIGLPCFSLKWDTCNGKCHLLNTDRKEPIYNWESGIITKNGLHLKVLINGSILRDNSGKITGGIVSFIDITKLFEAKVDAEKARDNAEKIACLDYLTGLLTRRAFEDRLKLEMHRAKRDGTILSIIMADIDRFKKVNDTYGHQAGDVVLQQLAKCLSRQCRPYDIIGRFGGEEFIICLPNTTSEQAMNIAERMRYLVQEQLIIVPGNSKNINITCSFGVSSLRNDLEEDIEMAITRADAALYQAKEEGRNRVCMAQ